MAIEHVIHILISGVTRIFWRGQGWARTFISVALSLIRAPPPGYATDTYTADKYCKASMNIFIYMYYETRHCNCIVYNTAIK